MKNKTTSQWNTLPTLPELDYLSPANQKAKAEIQRRIEAITLARADYGLAVENILYAPYDTLPEPIHPTAKMKILIEELKVRQDVQAWYASIQADREKALGEAKAHHAEIKREAEEGLLAMNYKRVLLPSLLKDNPEVNKAFNKVNRLGQFPSDKANEKFITAIVEQLKTMRAKMIA